MHDGLEKGNGLVQILIYWVYLTCILCRLKMEFPDLFYKCLILYFIGVVKKYCLILVLKKRTYFLRNQYCIEYVLKCMYRRDGNL